MLKRTTNQKISEEELCESNENHVDDSEQRNANKPKTIKKLIFEISSEMMTLSDLVLSTGFTDVDDNFRLRQKLNDIIHLIRKTQDFALKVKNSNKKTSK
jgi:hypothetical protein